LVGLVALAVTLVDVEAALDELCVEWFSWMENVRRVWPENIGE
jgi:hypothetical protein